MNPTVELTDLEFYFDKIQALDMKSLGMEEGDPFRLMIKRSGSRADAFSPATDSSRDL